MQKKDDRSHELTLTRIYDAPVQLVWEVWTDPKHVANWWGPRGFTLTTHSKDLREGGHWSYTMHGPDGTDYPNKTIYYEVIKYQRLVYDHGGSDDRPPLFRVTVNFKEVSNKTHMEMTMSFASAEVAKQMSQFIKKAGGESTWDRLAEYLAEKTLGKDILVIHRSLFAPIQRVFEMWSNPDHLKTWLPQYGSSTQKESHASNRILELTQTGPFQTQVSFEPEGQSKTRLRIECSPIESAAAAEKEAFHSSKISMNQSWNASLDSLEHILGS